MSSTIIERTTRMPRSRSSLPDGWTTQTLKQLSSGIGVGCVINPSTYFDDSGTVPMLLGSNIQENKIDWKSARRITEDSNRLLPASRLNAGDLVTVRVGEPGITAVIPVEWDGCNSASMMVIRQSPRFDSLWLCYVINSRIGRSEVDQVKYGSAQKKFNISDAEDFSFPVPPLDEPRAIAAALSDVDELIGALDKLIAKKRAIKLATMQQLLTGKTRLPGFSGEWEEQPLGNLAGVTLSPSGLSANTTYYIYAFDNNGQVALEASATGYATDTTHGHRIKSGDACRTLVGMARTNGSTQWVDSGAQRFVLSWFNRLPKVALANFTSAKSTTSTSYVELATEIRIEFLTWGDAAVQSHLDGPLACTGSGKDTFLALGFDGTTPEEGYNYLAVTSSSQHPASVSAAKTLSEGYHYSTVLAKASAGTARVHYHAASAGSRPALRTTIWG